MVNFQDWIFERLPRRFWEEDTMVVGGKGIFRRFIEAHGYELDTYITPKIGSLTEINSVLTTDEAYVTYIAFFLGNPPDTFYDEQKYRKLLRYILDLNKVKGTRLSYELLFGLLGVEVIITEDPLTEELYDTDLAYDLDHTYDLGCPPCSGYSIEILDPENNCPILGTWETDPLIEALLEAFISYVEPINARRISITGPGVVEPPLPVSVSITVDQNPIESGTEVTFTATPINGGTTPSYQWYLNGNPVGTDSDTYTNDTLEDGDRIYVVLTSSESNTSGNPATSNSIIMIVSSESFIFILRTLSAYQDISLFLDSYFPVETPDCTVDWGDGSDPEVVQYVGSVYHNYEEAGDHTVKILGFCPYFQGQGGLVEVVQWGNCGFIELGFQGSSNSLTTIPNGPITGATNLASAQYMFSLCSQLDMEIPEDLFSLCPNITSFWYAFQGCTGLTGSIPADLFRYNTLVGEDGFLYTFGNCTGLTGSIPADLFRYNTLLSSRGFYSTFQGCTGLTGSIPADLFRYNTLVGDYGFHGTFQSCIGLTGSIPVELFRYNTLVGDHAFFNTFQACTGLTGSIPEDLFRYNTLVSDYGFYGTFQACINISGSIPEGLFRYNTLVRDYGFYCTFSGCASLIGSIPVNLFKYNTEVRIAAFQATFAGCTGLTGDIPEDLFRYNTLVQGAQVGDTTYGAFLNTFNTCMGLTGSIPEDLFRYNTLAGHASFFATFQGCHGLTGSIPEGLFRYNTLNESFTNTFASCTGLTGDIPTDLFRYNTLATSFYSVFDNCRNLTMAPNGLFKYNTAARGFNYAFYNCLKLQLNPYIFYDAGQESTFFANRVMNFTSCFLRGSYSGVQGVAPALWTCTFQSVVSSGCFGGLGNSTTSLSNYSNIPTSWK